MSKITMSEWLVRYESIVNDRLNTGAIAAKTHGDYRRLIHFCRSIWTGTPLQDISIQDITTVIQRKAATSPFAARRLRINMSDLYMEAQRFGVLPLGHNPALIVRHPVTNVKTERLTFPEWLRIFRLATYRAPEYFQLAMLLALITGQRRADIVAMRTADIRDGYLHITQNKTGERIALPLHLRLDIAGCSLSEVISICPSAGPLVQSRGKSVGAWSITRWFQMCRDEAGIGSRAERTPPTFREIRSLAERLYRPQGIDTRTLLGHKYQHMTDGYNDIRDREYRKLAL